MYTCTIQNIILYGSPCFRNLTADSEKLHALPALGYFSFEIHKIAACFLWLSLPAYYRVTDEAYLAETT